MSDRRMLLVYSIDGRPDTSVGRTADDDRRRRWTQAEKSQSHIWMQTKRTHARTHTAASLTFIDHSLLHFAHLRESGERSFVAVAVAAARKAGLHLPCALFDFYSGFLPIHMCHCNDSEHCYSCQYSTADENFSSPPYDLVLGSLVRYQQTLKSFTRPILSSSPPRLETPPDTKIPNTLLELCRRRIRNRIITIVIRCYSVHYWYGGASCFLVGQPAVFLRSLSPATTRIAPQHILITSASIMTFPHWECTFILQPSANYSFHHFFLSSPARQMREHHFIYVQQDDSWQLRTQDCFRPGILVSLRNSHAPKACAVTPRPLNPICSLGQKGRKPLQSALRCGCDKKKKAATSDDSLALKKAQIFTSPSHKIVCHTEADGAVAALLAAIHRTRGDEPRGTGLRRDEMPVCPGGFDNHSSTSAHSAPDRRERHAQASWEAPFLHYFHFPRLQQCASEHHDMWLPFFAPSPLLLFQADARKGLLPTRSVAHSFPHPSLTKVEGGRQKKVEGRRWKKVKGGRWKVEGGSGAPEWLLISDLERPNRCAIENFGIRHNSSQISFQQFSHTKAQQAVPTSAKVVLAKAVGIRTTWRDFRYVTHGGSLNDWKVAQTSLLLIEAEGINYYVHVNMTTAADSNAPAATAPLRNLRASGSVVTARMRRRRFCHNFKNQKCLYSPSPELNPTAFFKNEPELNTTVWAPEESEFDPNLGKILSHVLRHVSLLEHQGMVACLSFMHQTVAYSKHSATQEKPILSNLVQFQQQYQYQQQQPANQGHQTNHIIHISTQAPAPVNPIPGIMITAFILAPFLSWAGFLGGLQAVKT
ncbi:uncharacterized protein MYCFIDRAFT_178659 [Pseudocercospora fijiensis CIRAD86]|uniref:Uncharacterized protein n=1 Tax=Pseudocercospora fijiensis (strain CIRAD86) TaxID=383855 RepID=M2ZHA8_PSEFD|nr:uncharacterized protein MYCFIDRAFT_178659 [Pseudocercospora fijiensis CIRAD86]EME78524.1 hypothetical protein MYCFIDRAFT_178659 [Pseudocercospora fijiensis CIRAD86]